MRGNGSGAGGGMSAVRLLAIVGAVLLVAAGCYSVWDDTSPGAVAARVHVNDLLDQAEAAHQGGDDVLAQQLRDEAAAAECTDFGCPPPVGTTTVNMDVTHAGGFFSAPWPDDTRRKPDGSIDLTGFPGRSSIPLADLVLGRGEAATFGFGTNSGVFFQSTSPIAPDSTPVVASLSVNRRSPAMLLDLDHPGAAPVPLLVDVKGAAATLRPANLVTLLPYPGHPLRSGTRYAAVLFTGLHDTSGNRLAPSPVLSQLDGAAPSGVSASTWAQLGQERDDAVQAVRDQTLWHPSELAAFSVFTTQNTTRDMQAMADAVAALPTPQPLSRTPDAAPCTPGSVLHSTGRLALPNWQQGTRPFINGGGGVTILGNGQAQQNGVEMGSSGQGVLLDMTIPCGPGPANGWPILLWMNGTGGTARANPISQLGPNLPFAVLSIAPFYSGDRLVPGQPAPFDTPEYQFYSYINPLAARTNQLQQAADLLYLHRLAQNLLLTPAEQAVAGTNHLDPTKVFMAGHSQGALTLPLTLAVDHGVQGAFLSSGGAGLYHSIVHRNDVRTLVDGLLGTGPSGELDIFHPYPQVLQTFSDIGDAANYGAAVQTNVVLYAGLRDGCSPIEVNVHLAESMGIPIAHNVTRRPVFGLGVPQIGAPYEPEIVNLPVTQNLPGGRTGVVVEVDEGHFGATTYPAVGRSFLDSLVATGQAVEDPGPLPAHAPSLASCVRFDAPPI